MLEIILCSLVTILPDYLYRRYRQGKRFGHEITLFSVWFELRFGIIGCLMLTVALITMIFYYHPSTIVGDVVLPDRPDHARSSRPGRGGPRRTQRARQARRRDFQTRQLQAGSRAADGQTQGRRSRCRHAVGAGRCPQGGRRRSSRLKSDYQQATDELNTKRELQQRNPGIVPQRDIEKLQVPQAGRQGCARCRERFKTIGDDPRHRAATRRESQRRSGAGRSAGRSGQDLYSRRCRRAGRAVRTEAGRYRQSNDAVGRHSDSGWRRTARPRGRVWPDRGSGHEGRNGGRGHLHFQAVDHHSDGGDQRAGLHRGGPVQGRRTTDRGAEHGDVPAPFSFSWSRSTRAGWKA